ncbi:hypothetical protein QWY85_19645 [Neolewinella lacunae]|uniref:TonB-dependent receptor n=1 Tax=Neolewinella lacunae TaxID=1517758 RepID=A0A923PR66_9BACT|nr:hypothetical protein [Neolewinella lacunae]MBC6996271.1 hypothetical protein [Neolewinella lacunae]MDN3636894.1 hypothetical protein [Neolewinella lacunae]
MKLSGLLPLLLVLFASTCVRAQTEHALEQNVLRGTLTDENQVPLPFASITLHPPGRDSILLFALTDAAGLFQLDTKGRRRVELRSRSLGMQTDTLLLDLPQESAVIVRLSKAKNELPDVVVRGARAPVTAKTDTTTFNVRDFRDSTDRKIEEVLRKLPGVEVKSDGSIEVFGKPLHRILVEGSDLFGADYQLGSKNLNARDIGRVEVIDRYQDNPVLRSVNNSQAVVLNLKLEEAVKSVLAGNVIAGGGYGDGAKYSAYASLYRIDRIHKSIFIGDLDNVGNDFGYGSANANYADRSASDLRRPATEKLTLISPTPFSEAGLRREYTDNGRTAFGTLRHESALAKSWTLNANLTGYRKAREQELLDRQDYVADDTRYDLQLERQLQREQKNYTGELELKYLAPNQKTSLQLFTGLHRAAADVQERTVNDNEVVSSMASDGEETATFRMLGSRELRPNLVAQAEIASGTTTQDYFATIVNPALANYFSLRENTRVEQRIDGRQRRDYATARILWKKGDLLSTFQLTAGKEQLSLEDLSNTYWSPSLALQYSFRDRTELRLGTSLRINNYAAFPDLPTTTSNFSLGFDREARLGRRLSVNLRAGRNYPTLANLLLTTVYFPDPFQIVRGGPAPEVGTYFNGRISYTLRNDRNLSSWRFSGYANRAKNQANATTDFAGDVLVSSWQFGGSNSAVGLEARYSIFVLPLKTDYALRVSSGYSAVDLGVAEQTLAFRYWRNTANLEGGILLFPRLRLKGNSLLSVNRLLGESRFFTNWNTEAQLLYTFAKGRLYTGLSQTANYREGERNQLAAAFLGAERRMQWKDQEAVLGLRIYNLTNRSAFVTQSVNDIFVFENRVPALGRFFLLSLDWSL